MKDGCSVHPRYWGRMIEALGLAFLIGGTLVLGMLVAPLLFLIAPLKIAALAMTQIFRQYDHVLAVVIGLVLVGEAVQIHFGSWRHGFAARMRSMMAFVMLVMMLFSTMSLHPRMEAYQKAGVIRGVGVQGQALDHLHQWAKGMMITEMTLGVLVLALLLLPVPHSSPSACTAKKETSA